MMLQPGVDLLLFSGFPSTFGAEIVAPGTTNVESRKAYPKNPGNYTCPAGASLFFDGAADWVAGPITATAWPTGAKWWKVRGNASVEYATPVTFTPTLDGVDFDFVVTTRTAVVHHLLSATIGIDGLSLTAVFSGAMQVGAGGSGGLVIDPDIDLTYEDGTGTDTFVFSMLTEIETGATVTISYTQPGDGLESTEGGDLVSFFGFSCINDSEYVPSSNITLPYTLPFSLGV